MPTRRQFRTPRCATMDSPTGRYMANKNASGWLSQRRAAARSGLPYSTVRRLVRDGEINGVRHGRGYLLSVSALDAFLAKRGVIA